MSDSTPSPSQSGSGTLPFTGFYLIGIAVLGFGILGFGLLGRKLSTTHAR